jgi:hypothetical protein
MGAYGPVTEIEISRHSQKTVEHVVDDMLRTVRSDCFIIVEGLLVLNTQADNSFISGYKIPIIQSTLMIRLTGESECLLRSMSAVTKNRIHSQHMAINIETHSGIAGFHIGVLFHLNYFLTTKPTNLSG